MINTYHPIAYISYLLIIIITCRYQIQSQMQQDNSNYFNVQNSRGPQERQPQGLFNKQTEIIKEGQRFKVAFGQMEQQKKTLQQIVLPYLHKFAVASGDFAVQAGTMTFQALKAGFLWVYNKIVGDVIPYAVENLPKLIFVPRSKVQPQNLNSGAIQVLVLDEDDYKALPSQQKKQGARVVIPIGPDNDKSFTQYLQKQNYQIKYDFPIDDDSVDNINVKRSFLIPSESFQVLCDGVDQAHAQIMPQVPIPKKRVAFRLNNCFVFDLEGQNTVQYNLDLLDAIQHCDKATQGYAVIPELSLKRNASDKQEVDDAISRFVAGKQKSVEEKLQKVVDMERKVEVDLTGPKMKPQAELALN